MEIIPRPKDWQTSRGLAEKVIEPRIEKHIPDYGGFLQGKTKVLKVKWYGYKIKKIYLIIFFSNFISSFSFIFLDKFHKKSSA